MLIGVECFKDSEIHSMITSRGKIGTCEITAQKEVMVYDTNCDVYLENDFSALLDVYSAQSDLPNDFPKEHLTLLEDILLRDWEIFKVESVDAKRIVMEICKNIYPIDSNIFNERVGMDKVCDSSFMERKCLMRQFSWEKFTSSIKNINRFHSNHINLCLLEKLFKSDSMQRGYKRGELTLYRGRIGDAKGYKKEEMGAPPLAYASSGRVNSAGISCLYLASDINTTYHEIRARDLDYVSIGKFILNKDIKIVDLSNLNRISPFASEADIEWFAVNMNILKKINNEIAKPLRRQDSELDYLPAQYISDFIKSLGFEGICYRSTLNKQGLNYAFFNEKNFRCEEVKVYHIKSMEFKVELYTGNRRSTL